MTHYNVALRRRTEAVQSGAHYAVPFFSLVRADLKEGDVSRKEYLAERRNDQRARIGSSPFKGKRFADGTPKTPR